MPLQVLQVKTLLWRRLDVPGHETVRFTDLGDVAGRVLDGSAVFLHGDSPCRLDYKVRCDGEWRTRTASVRGWLGDEEVSVHVWKPRAIWYFENEPRPDVGDCEDVDLAFTPATNMLPIRRLDLGVGAEARLAAAWLTFPDLRVQRVEQVYRRIGMNVYEYEAPGLGFRADLEVNDEGMIVDYEGLWTLETQSRS